MYNNFQKSLSSEGLLLPKEIQDSKLIQDIKRRTSDYSKIMSYYRCAMLEIETKFRVLSENFSFKYERNPIETVKCRLKSIDSIVGKLTRKGLPLTTESIESNLFDIAGVRVICGFVDDVYALTESFLSQDDITLVEKKDYIKNPKENGYRSLHLVVEIPIFLFDEKRIMKVEIQLRTIAMDFWASLEHQLRYKKDRENITEGVVNELTACANMSATLDERMNLIHRHVLGEDINIKE